MINQTNHGIDGKYTQIENPCIQSLKKQKFKCRNRSFAILEVTTISLPPKTPHHTMGHHPPNNQISMIAIMARQPAHKSNTRQGITQCTPNKPNTIDHNSQARGQCSNKWSTLSPLCLHIQHRSTRIRCHFCKLSIVKSLPKAVVHEKKATLGGILAFQILFQGKGSKKPYTYSDNTPWLKNLC